VKRLAIFLGLIVLLPVAVGVPENITTGPYKISFDLGMPKDAYLVTENAPEISENLGGDETEMYSVTINNTTSKNATDYIKIYVLSINRPTTLATGAMVENVLKDRCSRNSALTNIYTDTRTIDGQSGAVASVSKSSRGSLIQGYEAMYQASFDPHTLVDIQSFFPWNRGTLQLLKTIHVKKT